MFASLKNKIKEETGAQILPLQNNNNRVRSRYNSSTLSVNSNADEIAGPSQTNEYVMNEHLRSQCNELTTKTTELAARIQALQAEKANVEKTNEILLESVKVAQTQKDLYCEEQEKIQNMQQNEIDKLKNLLSFREQEAVDRLSALHQSQQQVENLTGELERLKPFEPMMEDLQDELQRLRHSAQLDKNNRTTTLAAIEEENRHLKSRLHIVEQARLETIQTLNSDEQLKALVHERKLLTQHLEEAQLQLSDIKSSWSGQNLALETQVSRLSQQVAEETTEKRKALKDRDDLREQVKQLKFEMLKLNEEMQQRNDKIRLLEEDIDELGLALKECREESEQQVLYERNKSEMLETDTKDLKARLEHSDERFSEYAANAESVALALRQQNTILKEKLNDCQNKLDIEKDDKVTALLRNAEISQSEELLRKELRHERDESNELHTLNVQLQTDIKAKQQEANDSKLALENFKTVMHNNELKMQEIEELQRQISEKNKTIKMLNQHVADLKKTLQKELNCTPTIFETTSDYAGALENGNFGAVLTAKSKSIFCNNTIADGQGGIVMDEVNFKYLKHVIVKFLTSREVEARHLIRAVATLLKLSKEEEQLLHDTLNWKMSWFGAKPDHGSGQRAVSIPPS